MRVTRRAFLNKLINFMGVGIALYAIANIYEWVSSDSIIKHTIKCKYCRKRISEKVKALLHDVGRRLRH
jgi:large conductance mechanosensitive channel